MTLKRGFIGIVTQNMAASLAFYRRLGVSIAEGQDDAPHVDAKLDDGTTLAWDTIETIRGFDAGYTTPVGGHRIALAFEQGSTAGVDAAFAELIEAGYASHVDPLPQECTRTLSSSNTHQRQIGVPKILNHSTTEGTRREIKQLGHPPRRRAAPCLTANK